MTGMTLGLILAAAHLGICFIIWLFVHYGALKVPGCFLPFMILVPVYGPLAAVLLHTKNTLTGSGLTPPDMDKLKINEEQYRSIIVEGRGAAGSTIPLEEALIVNSVGQRRQLMLSILNDSPEDYIGLLNQARLNADTEVVHYASTAIAQISKDADLRLQKYEQRYVRHQDDPEALNAYCDYLREYLDSGLASGRAAEIQQRQYILLLKKSLRIKDDYETGCRLAGALIKTEQYDEADKTIKDLIKQEPGKEAAWLLRIRAAAGRHDGAGVEEALRLIKENNIYLSHDAREELAFWQEKTEKQPG